MLLMEDPKRISHQKNLSSHVNWLEETGHHVEAKQQ